MVYKEMTKEQKIKLYEYHIRVCERDLKSCQERLKLHQKINPNNKRNIEYMGWFVKIAIYELYLAQKYLRDLQNDRQRNSK